jgi:hypothetical protein
MSRFGKSNENIIRINKIYKITLYVFSVQHCFPDKYDKSNVNKRKSDILARAAAVQALWDPTAKPAAKRIEDFKKKVDTAKLTLKKEEEAINKKLALTTISPSMKQKLTDQLKDLTDRMAAEDNKVELFTRIANDAVAKLTIVKDKPKSTTPTASDIPQSISTAETAVETAKTALDDKLKVIDELRKEFFRDEAKLKDEMKLVYEKGTLSDAYQVAVKALEVAISEWDREVSEAEVLVGEVETFEKNYKLGPKKRPKRIEYIERAASARIEMSGDPAAATPIHPAECNPIPKRSEECSAGKPEKAISCDLLSASSGTSVFTEPKDVDYWKKEVMELIGEVFVNACPLLPNRRKFVKKIALIVGYYLKSPLNFNQLASKKIPKQRIPLASNKSVYG